jgi:hypothetical protein
MQNIQSRGMCETLAKEPLSPLYQGPMKANFAPSFSANKQQRRAPKINSQKYHKGRMERET